ncbi:DUF2442 domain-containing protein [Dyadobacter psychrotolerans]|uniref:DUF2442 domain-containing protein n=1 Tax=Dyadobacter psychrotolerans TaxID=2541721 RepID=A0A4R5DI39_9BACT|nr:DUF2442 domain-containing protein [Dyadobacter psychrotolerans]TDE11564.1 DUF2442 domain-containing protein [Dyadobacter psychrotolerans]
MLHYIKKIVNIQDYSVTCLFNTGEVRVIDLKNVIEKYSKINDGLISRLAEKSYFDTVQLDSYGTLYWENGVDFDPDNLYKISHPEIVPI